MTLLRFLVVLVGAALSVPAAEHDHVPLPTAEFHRFVVKAAPETFSTEAIPAPTKSGHITIDVRGNVRGAGILEVPESTTAVSLQRTPGVIFWMCLGPISILRQEGPELVVYVACSAGRSAAPFPLKQGDRIFYVGGGI